MKKLNPLYAKNAYYYWLLRGVSENISSIREVALYNSKGQVFWEAHKNLHRTSKLRGRLRQIFEAFSEYMNFRDMNHPIKQPIPFQRTTFKLKNNFNEII